MISIRTANIEDVEPLMQLCRSSFYDTYSAFNTEEDMAIFLEEHFNADRISEELKDEEGVTLLAYNVNKLAGYARLSPKKKPKGLEQRQPVEIERIYVSKDQQGHRIGYMLMEQSIRWATEKGYDVLWLGVWENNPKAIAFYERQGMVKFGMQEFILGHDVQHDHLMRLSISDRN